MDLRRSRRNMSQKDIAAETARVKIFARNQEIRETALRRRARRRIKGMSPRTSRKIKSGVKKLQAFHRARTKTRRAKEAADAAEKEARKRSRMRKQKETREVKKYIKKKDVKLDKDNMKMLRVLLERNIPIEVAVQISENRQVLQTIDKKKRKKLKDL